MKFPRSIISFKLWCFMGFLLRVRLAMGSVASTPIFRGFPLRSCRGASTFLFRSLLLRSCGGASCEWSFGYAVCKRTADCTAVTGRLQGYGGVFGQTVIVLLLIVRLCSKTDTYPGYQTAASEFPMVVHQVRLLHLDSRCLSLMSSICK